MNQIFVHGELKKELLFISILLLVIGLYPNAYTQPIPIKNGVNIQASYYNRGQVNFGWDLMLQYPEIAAVRIEIEPDRTHQARQWIREAHENGYQVIATYHVSKQLGSDKIEHLEAATSWWVNNYESLTASGPVFINIMNEWGSHNINPLDFATAYNKAITEIRTIYKDWLIVDIPGYGQATDLTVEAFPHFEDTQLLFSVHIYANAFNVDQNRWLQVRDLAQLAATGANCMIGEFCAGGRGGADWCSLVDYAYSQTWPIFGWAWNGDGSNMNMVEPHWRDQPLATSFTPTQHFHKIINKLAGLACYLQPDPDCTAASIGATCDDANDYTINDTYNEYCHCVGNFTNVLLTPTNEPTLLLYPNPVTDQLFIDVLKIRGAGVLRIYTPLGQVVQTFPINTEVAKIAIDTESLLAGVYVVSVAFDKNLLSELFLKH